MRPFRALLSLACLLAGGSSSYALVIAGSDLLDAPVRDALLGELQAAGIEASLSLQGSLLGMKALAAGTANACILGLPEGGAETGSLRSFPVAFQIVTFLVHADNPVTELSYAQLANLFGGSSTSSNWSSLTPAADWSNRKITLWAARSQSTITLEIFNALVLKGSSLNPAVRYSTATAQQLIALVVEDPTALVLAPAIVPGTAPVRLLAVRSSADQQAYTPSPDNVLYGDYPLRLPFNLVVAAGLGDEALGKLLRAVYSPAVTAALQAMNCVAVTETERRSILAQYD